MTKGTNGIHHHLWHSPSKMKFWTIFHFLNNFLKFVTHRNMFAFFFLISNASYLPQIVFHQSPPTQIVSSTVSSVGTVFIPFYFRIGPIDRNLSLFFHIFHFPNSSASLPSFFLVEFPVLFLFLHLPSFSSKFAFEYFYHQRSCHSTRCLLAALSRRSQLVRRPVF